MNLWKKINLFFMGVLVGCLFFSVTPVAHGFFTISAGRQLDELKFLTQNIFKPQWKIGYRYHTDCTPAERQNDEALKEAMSASLRTWLAPLKELNPERPIVDKFVYVKQPDFNPINPEDHYNPNQPEDLAGWGEVDLRVTFECTQGISYALTGLKFQPAVFMRLGTEITPLLLIVLTHEFGHAFGLDDTIARETTPIGVMKSHGGLQRTAGNQPASLMAFSGSYHRDAGTPLALGEDDKRGIIWLYKYFHSDVPPDDCFFDDYVYVQITEPFLMHRCAPKHPLIFETKHNPAKHALQLLMDDPSINPNTQDTRGMTALHYAAMYGKVEVVKALLAHKDIKISLKNKQDQTPLDIALAANHTTIIEMFPNPPPLKEDVNGDGVVNILDLVAVAASFGQKDAGNADINADGTVDIRDLVLVAGKMGD